MPSASEKSAKGKSARVEETLLLHPKSRKCRAVVKKLRKDTKKERNKQETKLKQSLIADKLLWFQKNMDSSVCPYTVELTTALVEKYMARNDEELEQINIKRSIGVHRNKQHIGREQAINMTKERERNDFESCGLEIPDILNISQCSMLQKWNGDLKLIPAFKFCHFKKRQLEDKLKKKQESNHKKGRKEPQNDCTGEATTQNQSDVSKVVDTEISTSISQTTEDKMDVE
ncbi:translation machinery-associated protein 16 [Copidosoma floridanum]|uniref:translation machinery-associated protein 16 n=1 Tax=Copidosoma floridanum TaxID=29053 RepID=UPI0006C9A856|nr:translation machinery-associated protein 16 [Copidosoma floridanum]